jgi:very-short-patch-repair endonuclease
MTPAESLRWGALHREQVRGVPFRRQHPIGQFVLDFACPSRKLAIEVDGSVHITQTEQDAERTETLKWFGWTVVRFSNHQVSNDLPGVVAEITELIDALPLAPGQRGRNSPPLMLGEGLGEGAPTGAATKGATP